MRAKSLAAACLALAGGLHLVAFVVSGFAEQILPYVIIGIMYVALAKQLVSSEQRGVQWVVFLFLILASIFALSQTGGLSPVPDSLTYAIVLLEWACILSLFLVLWCTPKKPTL
ncbi:MAG: hypothetical protein AAGF46_08330 [Pseudomonadota bacterium]